MNLSPLDRAGACAVAVYGLLALCSPAAHADFGVSFGGGGGGAFTPTDPDLPVILASGTGTTLPDGSFIGHVNCVDCSTDGQPIIVDTWYKRANAPTLAAGQAYADYGLLKARSWVTSGANGDSQPGNPPGTYSYFGGATAEWREDLIYSGSTPTTVTMQFTLHAKWNDLGRFDFTIGRDTIGAENVRVIDGPTYVNCAGPIESAGCDFGANSPLVQVLGNDLANTSGDVTLAINYSFQLGADLVDPENPLPPLPYTFVALLQTRSIAPGAEVDAFQTVTLDRILIEPGAQITFASGHNWPVQVVPEPQTVLLWLAGLAAIVPLARRGRAAA